MYVGRRVEAGYIRNLHTLHSYTARVLKRGSTIALERHQRMAIKGVKNISREKKFPFQSRLFLAVSQN